MPIYPITPISRYPICSLTPFTPFLLPLPLLHGELQRPQWPARPDVPLPLPLRRPHPLPPASSQYRQREETMRVAASTVPRPHPGTAGCRWSIAHPPWRCVWKSSLAWFENQSTHNCPAERDAADASYSSTLGWTSGWPRSRSETECGHWRYRPKRTARPLQPPAPPQQDRDSWIV